MLFTLVCDLYEIGETPTDFKVNKTVTMPKKVGLDKCENYITISLTKHTSKILTTIMHRTIEQTIENSIGEDQFGFRKKMGTIKALLPLRLIESGRIRVGKPPFIAFVDLEKAFDNVG